MEAFHGRESYITERTEAGYEDLWLGYIEHFTGGRSGSGCGIGGADLYGPKQRAEPIPAAKRADGTGAADQNEHPLAPATDMDSDGQRL